MIFLTSRETRLQAPIHRLKTANEKQLASPPTPANPLASDVALGAPTTNMRDDSWVVPAQLRGTN